MSTIRLTPREAKWVAHMAEINKGVLERHYVAVDPEGGKHLVFIFSAEYLAQYNTDTPIKTYETWSPLIDQGGWKYFGNPMPDWALGPVQPLLTEDFSEEQMALAEEIIRGK